MEVQVDVADLAHLEHPARGDPRPGAPRVEPEVEQYIALFFAAFSSVLLIELMLNAVNLSIVAFGAFNPLLRDQGSIIALMVMAVAAGEATVGLAT